MSNRLTLEQINAGKTPKGGWSKAQLAEWGVPWPPAKGWQQKLIAGETFPAPAIKESLIRPGVDAHDLLRQVVVAVINANHAADLHAFPDVLEYFGSHADEVPDNAYGPTTRHLFAPMPKDHVTV